MTAPDAAPSVEDVIARALSDVQWRHQEAAAVVAAIRAMTVEQQAELIGGEVETLIDMARVVGPWRVEP